MRDRILFYLSLGLIVVGGLDLALGSLLHDKLHIPIVGRAYTIFGPINVLYATVGLVLFLLGIILIILSVRGGVLSPEEVERIRSEGEIG